MERRASQPEERLLQRIFEGLWVYAMKRGVDFHRCSRIAQGRALDRLFKQHG